MARREEIQKVLVIGSGPIVIGQAAEFDYAGTQACKALSEEGVEVVLVNSNPATIMTDPNVADRVYLEPLTRGFVERVLARERPDGLLPTLGGQTGLNLAFELASEGVLERLGVELLGTPLSAIERAEDREQFKTTMQEMGEPVPESTIASKWDEARAFAEEIGFPIIVRPAYTLGGTGGGIATEMARFEEIVTRGLGNSIIHQVLLERSVAGWKEIEYEVMRDGDGNCITVCSMENFDPVGIHTGDSIVAAPVQTLSDKEHQMLRMASLRIIGELGIEGGCNVQFALSPERMQYHVIEVNPRVSRSSALASKATGYPIAKVAAKIAIGLRLHEIPNAVTRQTPACFEPALDYVVVKIPRWPFDKFTMADRALGTQMKATGEVMAIERTLEAALLKAVRSLEIGADHLRLKGMGEWREQEVGRRLSEADDQRLFVMAEALRRGFSVGAICEATGVDRFFVAKLWNIVRMERELSAHLGDDGDSALGSGAPSANGAARPPEVESEKGLRGEVPADLLRRAKQMGFVDRRIGELIGRSRMDVRSLRERLGIRPVYKMVDTCAGEFEARTPYYYSTYEEEDEADAGSAPKAVVLGAGPIRIGQGIEFDYCSVHSAWALKEAGIESVVINNNPETVSTDFDTSDRLYFEPLTPEDVREICEAENALGVVVQFGGQTAINLAGPLQEIGIPILGTAIEGIDASEDREQFGRLLDRLGIPQTEGKTATALEEAVGIALKIGFPLLVRPSYVLGGRAMEIVHNEAELLQYMKGAVELSNEHPVLLDRYLPGREVEVDAVCDGERVLIPGILEHVERAGVHSGDSTAVYPAGRLEPEERERIVSYTRRIALSLGVRGLINIQYVVHAGRVIVLEANPRASRTVPFLSKVTGVPMVKLATRVMLGERLRAMGFPDGLLPPTPYVTAKAPVFSFEKLGDVETSLGPEMKSTGEVLGVDESEAGALYRAWTAAGLKIPERGTILVTLADKDKVDGVALMRRFADHGFRFAATQGTAAALREAGLDVQLVHKIGEGTPDVVDAIRAGSVDMVINTPTRGKIPARNGFKMRRAAVEYRMPCLTALDGARAILEVTERKSHGEGLPVRSLQEYLSRGAGERGDGGRSHAQVVE